MPFPTTLTTGPAVQVNLSGVKPFTQSKETGELSPETQPHGQTIAKETGPRAKPWAHFIAGGYVWHPMVY